jgi:hypothetical protein
MSINFFTKKFFFSYTHSYIKTIIIGGEMKKMRIFFSFAFLFLALSLAAEQMWVVGEVFTQTW